MKIIWDLFLFIFNITDILVVFFYQSGEFIFFFYLLWETQEYPLYSNKMVTGWHGKGAVWYNNNHLTKGSVQPLVQIMSRKGTGYKHILFLIP